MNNNVQMCSHSLETTIIGGTESSWAFASQIKSLPSFIGLINSFSSVVSVWKTVASLVGHLYIY